MADDDALQTVLDVQHALLPSRDRVFPFEIDLAHDYVAWYQAMLEVKEGGELEGWPSATPSLRSFGPARFVVDDPGGFASLAVGANIEAHGFGLNWELETPLARAFAIDGHAEKILT